METLTVDSLMNTTAYCQQFVASLVNSPEDGMLKSASETATAVTRRILREDSFTPAIIPFENIDNSQLYEMLDSEDPAVLYEMEAAQSPAVTINLNDSAPISPYYADKYLLVFYTNSTPVWTKNVNYLRTYKGNIRQLVGDNSVRDMGRQKDGKFLSDVDSICGPRAGSKSPVTGLEQWVLYPGRLTRNNWVSTTELLKSRSLMNGCMLMNFRTFDEFMRWPRNEMGGDMSEKLIIDGASALGKSKMSGIDLIVTLKHDFVPNGVVYAFAPPNYLGHAGVLEHPTMYIKKEMDMLTFRCKEIVGVSIGNTAGVQKASFQDIQNEYGGDGRLDNPA